MRGVTSIGIAVGLLSLAMWAWLQDASPTTVLMFGAGALFLFYRGYQGQDVTQVEDVTAPMDFVANPARAIVDAAAEKVGEMLTESRPAEPKEEQSSFDPDAVIARYLENRPAQPSALDAAPPRPQFGRKGL